MSPPAAFVAAANLALALVARNTLEQRVGGAAGEGANGA